MDIFGGQINVQFWGSKMDIFWFMDFPIFKRNIFDGFIIETSFGGCPESNLYKLLILNDKYCSVPTVALGAVAALGALLAAVVDVTSTGDP